MIHAARVSLHRALRIGVHQRDIPLRRAYRPTSEERMIRELVLQLKLGSVRPAYFEEKYGVDLLDRFRDELAALAHEGYVTEASTRIVALSRQGLLRVDTLLPRFFLPEHAGLSDSTPHDADQPAG